MELIALTPALASLALCLVASPARAFLAVYLPVLLLLPDHFRCSIPGIPDPGFQHAAILPIALLLPLLGTTRFRFSATDLLVLLFTGAMVVSEFVAAGTSLGRKLGFDVLCLMLLPYVLGKALIQPEGLSVRVARRIVVLLGVVTVLSLWEFRMGVRLFDTALRPFFPDAVPKSTQFRFGFGRIGGPFEHAILAGMVFGVGVLLAVWLLRTRRWASQATARFMLGGVVAGSLMTLSRGPWAGLLAGLCLAVMGLVRSRQRALVMLAFLGLVALPPALIVFGGYTSADLTGASELQGTAIYRTGLIPTYWPTVMERPLLGWGAGTWPQDETYYSVDNHYLLLALRHGLVSVALFVALVGWVGLRLVRLGLSRPPGSVSGGLAFALLGILVSFMLCLGTVYLGAQTQPLLMLVLGWGEGLVLAGRHEGAAHRVGARSVAARGGDAWPQGAGA